MNAPVECEIPEGWEPVAVRVPKAGEYYLFNKPVKCNSKSLDAPRLILRRKFVWPPWLTAPWIARDGSGDWWGHQDEPSIEHLGWTSDSDMCDLAEWAFDIPLPDLPWRESKMRNPHRSEACSGA